MRNRPVESPRKKADILARFQADLKLRGRSTSAQVSYGKKLRAFTAWYGGDLRGVEPDDLKAYLASLRARNLRTNTISSTFVALGSFFDFLEAEGEVSKNPIPAFRRRYLKTYKAGSDRYERRKLEPEEVCRIYHIAFSSRNQAIIVLLAKTGMRVGELAALDIGDVDVMKKEIHLKPTPKRSNRILYFDDETARILARWLSDRKSQGYDGGALLTAAKYTRLGTRGIEDMVMEVSRLAGVGDHERDHITPHYFRIFFTSELLRAGMARHFVQELRGDADSAAIDVYTRIDREELRRSYLACIPQLGI